MMFKEQAEKCRKQADEFAGRPEAPFLLKVARAFDELEIDAGTAVLVAGRKIPGAAGRVSA